MSNETIREVEIAQMADQLMTVAHQLLELANGNQAIRPGQLSTAPRFKAEMRRYHANGEHVDLSEIEARILDALLSNRGNLVTKRELCEVLDLDPDRQGRNLKSYVYRLKAKLNRMRQPGVTIQPIHGAGYVLSEATADPASASA